MTTGDGGSVCDRCGVRKVQHPHVCRPADVEARKWRAANPDPAVYYTQTGHCYGCGAPGTFCQCRDSAPCGCRHLHDMGSGLAADPTVVFAAEPVPDDQGELFGGTG